MKNLKKLLAAALALVMLCALLPAASLAAGTEYAVQISSTPNGTVVSDHDQAVEGTTVILTIVPFEGYRFEEDSLRITAAGGQTVSATITSAGGNIYRADFEMPGSAVTVTVSFA